MLGLGLVTGFGQKRCFSLKGLVVYMLYKNKETQKSGPTIKMEGGGLEAQPTKEPQDQKANIWGGDSGLIVVWPSKKHFVSSMLSLY